MRVYFENIGWVECSETGKEICEALYQEEFTKFYYMQDFLFWKESDIN